MARFRAWLDWKGRRLTVRLVVAFAIVALASAYLTTLFSGYFISRQFTEYLSNQRLERELLIIETLQEAINSNEVSDVLLQDLSSLALLDHSFFLVEDGQGSSVWLAEAIRGRGMGMGRWHGNQGSYHRTQAMQEISYELVGSKQLTRVTFGYLPDPRLSPAQVAYARSIWSAGLISAGLVATIGAVWGWHLSRRLGLPLQKLTRKVLALQSEKVSTLSVTQSFTDEISELAWAFDRLETSLKQQEQSRQQLIKDIAHELRTPLAALQAQVEAIQDGVYLPTPERLAACHQEIIRMGSLITDMDNLSRLEAGIQSLELRYCNLAEVIAEVVESFQAVFRQAGLHLHVSLQPVQVKADRDRLKQVMVNLLSNAAKYVYSGGNVWVDLKTEGSQAVLTVSDDGKGLNQGDLPYIFERFYRAEKSRSRKTGGVGLGLAITKAIVESHQGSIYASNRPQGGALFQVRLPLGS